MNEQRIEGAAQELKGGAKQAVAEVTGDQSLHAEGTVDRLTGTASQAMGAARDAVTPLVEGARDAAAPIIDKARTLTREKPWAVAALLGVIGVAIVGTLRGRGKSEPATPAKPSRTRSKA